MFSKDQVLGIVRHVATFGAGILISKGWIDSQTALELTGAVVALVGVIWSVKSKVA